MEVVFLGLGFSERGLKYWCRFLGGGVEEIWVAFVGRGCGACGRFFSRGRKFVVIYVGRG